MLNMDNDFGFVVEQGSRWDVCRNGGPSVLAATPADLAEFVRKHGSDGAGFRIRRYDGFWLSFTSVPVNPDNEGWQGPFSSAEYAIEVALDCLADPEITAADCLFDSWEYEAA